mmetsp:Transcript_26960/g.59251  ORF Transcript_26960/g.59251 Transcript_26960/m.59251 type:complete len:518 (+) Transcript_26960:213-1766(+)
MMDQVEIEVPNVDVCRMSSTGSTTSTSTSSSTSTSNSTIPDERENENEAISSNSEMVLNVTSAMLALAFSRAAPVAVSRSMAFDTLDTDNLCRVPTEDDTYYDHNGDGSGRLRSLMDDEEDTILTWGSRVTLGSFDEDEEDDDSTSLEFDHECNDLEGVKEENEHQQLSEQKSINNNHNLLTLTPVRKGQIEISLNSVQNDTTRHNRKHRTWTTPLLATKKIMTTILKKSSAAKNTTNSSTSPKGRQQKEQHTTRKSPIVVKKEPNTKKQQGQMVIRYTYTRSDGTTDEESCASTSDHASLPSTSTIEGSDDGSAARAASALVLSSKSSSFTKETTPEPTPTTTSKPDTTSKNLAGFEVQRITTRHVSITPDEVVAMEATTSASTESSSNTTTATAKSGADHDNDNGKNDNKNDDGSSVNGAPGKASNHNNSNNTNNTLPIRTFEKRTILGSHPILNNDDGDDNDNNIDEDIREKKNRDGKIGQSETNIEVTTSSLLYRSGEPLPTHPSSTSSLRTR